MASALELPARKRLLWVGDAVTPTGFSQVTHNILNRLRPLGWAVGVLGINYTGDPIHPAPPYPIWPAHLGGDMWGVERFRDLVEQSGPEIVLILNDPWIVSNYLEEFKGKAPVPIVAYMPVDGRNLPRKAVAVLNRGLALAIAYTEFGAGALRDAGYKGKVAVVPHGVDREIYRPLDKAEAREHLGLPQDAFLVGNVNRNQLRKRLDLTIMYFARWLEDYDVAADAYLVLHCAKRDIGWDLVSLAEFYGIKDRVIFTSTAETSMRLPDQEVMPYVYNALDLQVSTTMGEGWGLTQHEGMACGIPQLVPDWAALGEWPQGSVAYAYVSSYMAAPNMLTTIGGIADEASFISMLDLFYRDATARKDYGHLAFLRATEERFRWDSIAASFDTHLTEIRGLALGPSAAPTKVPVAAQRTTAGI